MGASIFFKYSFLLVLEVKQDSAGTVDDKSFKLAVTWSVAIYVSHMYNKFMKHLSWDWISSHGFPPFLVPDF